jgi:deazaflavin-dependent oxidoreductase (nitroreductase family)
MPSNPNEEEKYLYLTTIGRNSGLPRPIEIWFVEFESRYYILAEHFHQTQWVKNIKANPRVSVRVRGREFQAIGRVLDEESDQALWQTAQRLAYEKYGWGDGLPVELVPDKN